jgi:hypothetical protein
MSVMKRSMTDDALAHAGLPRPLGESQAVPEARQQHVITYVGDEEVDMPVQVVVPGGQPHPVHGDVRARRLRNVREPPAAVLPGAVVAPQHVGLELLAHVVDGVEVQVAVVVVVEGHGAPGDTQLSTDDALAHAGLPRPLGESQAVPEARQQHVITYVGDEEVDTR